MMNTESLINDGYTIENAKITSIDLNMMDHGVLTLYMGLNGDGWGCTYGSYVLGKGFLGAKKFEGSAKRIEYIMRIMDTIGVSKFQDLVGRYIRVATTGWGSTIKIIGNIIEDKWFDPEEFFKEEN